MSTTARDAIATAATANGWQVHTNDETQLRAVRDGVTVTVSFTTSGTVQYGWRDVADGASEHVGARDSGKRETVLGWLEAPAKAYEWEAVEPRSHSVGGFNVTHRRTVNGVAEYRTEDGSLYRRTGRGTDSELVEGVVVPVPSPAKAAEPTEAPSHHWQDCHDKDCDDTHYGDEEPAPVDDMGERETVQTVAAEHGWQATPSGTLVRGDAEVTVLCSDRPGNPVTSARHSDGRSVSPKDVRRMAKVLGWLRTPQHVVVYGYEWRDATYGNSYQTFIAYADGVEVARSEYPAYGYGDHYVTLAWDAVQSTFRGVQATLSRWADDNGVTLTTSKFTVKRKRDLPTCSVLSADNTQPDITYLKGFQMNIYELNDALRPIVEGSGANLSDDAFDDLVWQVAAVLGIDASN